MIKKQANRSFICVHGYFGKYAIDAKPEDVCEAHVEKETIRLLASKMAEIQLKSVPSTTIKTERAKLLSQEFIDNSIINVSNIPVLRRALMLAKQEPAVKHDEIDTLFQLTTLASQSSKDIYLIF
jgi:predicted RNA methylase